MSKTRRKKLETKSPLFKSTGDRLRASAQTISLLVGLMVAVACVVVATHWPALSTTALSFDDDQYLTRNPLVQNPSWSAAGQFLSEILKPSTVGGYYQPLTMISLMVDHAIGGRWDDLRPFHRTSLALHVGNTCLVIALLYLLFGKPWVAAMVGLLFGVHPMTVEPIPWVGERKTLLAAFFALWSLICYVHYARTNGWKYYAGCLAMYVLALMSKPTSTPLPVVMLLMDFWPLRRLSGRAVLEKVPFLAIGGISAIITFISQKQTGAVIMPAEHAPARIPLILCHNIVFYLHKMIWPSNLTSHYAFPKPLNLSSHAVLAGVMGTALLVPSLLISLRWTRSLLTGWLIFMVACLPTMNIIGFSDVIASDKFAYLPSVGILMILTWWLTHLLGTRAEPTSSTKRWWAVRLAIVFTAIVGLAASESVATRRQLIHWKNTESLYRRMASFAPDVAIFYPTIAYQLNQRGLRDEAIANYRKALKLDPNHRFAYHTNHLLANLLVQKGQYAEAIEHYRESLRQQPNFVDAHNNLGIALLHMGKTEEAIESFEAVLRFEEKDVAMLSSPTIRCDAYNNLASALVRQERIDEAADALVKALKLNPDLTVARINLGALYERRGKMGEAIKCYKEALRIKPDSDEAHNNLGRILGRQGKTDQAIPHFKAALRINPNNAKARQNLKTALARRQAERRSP